MSKKITLFLLALLLFATLLGGCRRDAEEATPTMAAQAATATRRPAASPTARPERPTATRPAATAEAEVDQLTLDPASIDWPPQVVQSSPHTGEEALLDGAITIRFDQPMDQESVEDAFTIASAEDETVRGQFEWPEANVLVFTPASRLSGNQNYRVQIGQQAAARSGRTLQEPVELQFETVGALEVAQVIPGPDTENVETDGSITVLFNRPVVPLVTTGQQEGLPDPLQLEPEVAGEGRWLSTSIYRFTPDEPLAGATGYEATIPAGVEGIMGATLEEAYSWSFSTVDPSVATIVPGNGDQMVDPTFPLTVTFNMPMDQASVENALSLAPNEPLSFAWSDDGRTVILNHDGMLELGTRYTLTVDESATAASGQASLDRRTSSIFTTVPYPDVARTSPGANEEAPRYQYGIHIEFNAPMDPETIEGRIQIEPAPEDEPDYFVREQFANINFPLVENTTYRITIPADVADPYGNTLGEPYSWTFTTPPPAPVVSLNLPAPVSQLSDDHPTAVDIVYRNVSAIDVSLYDLELPVGLLVEPYRTNEFRPGGEPLRTWTQAAEAPENVARHFSLNLAGEGEEASLAPGVYYLLAGAPEIQEDVRYWQNQRNLLVVGDTNLVVKEMFGSVYVWATNLASGEPAAALSLTLYNANGVGIGSAITDDQGLARFDYEPPRDYLPGVVVVAGNPGESGFGVGSSNWNQNAGPWQFNIPATSSDEPPTFVYLYTDRPIYRPGDSVRFRGILRQSDYARYNLPDREQVTVQSEFVSFTGEDEGILYGEQLTVDANGTFNGEFVLPEDASLGRYRLFLPQQGEIANANLEFTVADYRRPEFIVTVTPEESELLRGETVDVVVEARYFFGAPASDLPVQWTVRELPYNLPWQGSPWYSFNDDDSFYFDYFGDQSGYYGNFVREGSGRTDADGRLVITLPADLLAEVEAGSRRVTLEANIRDLSEFPVTATGEIVFHAAELYAGIAPTTYLAEADEETSVQLITVDWEAEPVPGQQVEVVFYERDYEYVTEDRFGSDFGQWEPVDTEVARTTVTTDDEGEAVATFVPENGGTYRAVASVSDAQGNSQRSSTLFWVSDSDFVAWRVNPEEKRMDLTPDQRTYEVGDSARILVQSPFAGPVNAWLTIERGDLLEQRLITLQSNSEVVEIPIGEGFAPNAFVTIVAVQGSGEEQFADIRLGIAELVVPPDRLQLNISLTPRDDLLSPGETVTYDIQVSDYAGQPVQADLSLALVDLAVLTLQEDNARPIVDAFYQRQPYRSETGSGLFVSGEGLEIKIPKEALGLGGGGGGGDELAMAADQAVEEEEEPGVRRDFPDTAFWRANLITDDNGQATVQIPLPDTLTTWRLSSKAVTADSLVGQTSVDVVATLPLLIRPVTPRFFTVNDVVQIGAVVNNNSGQALDVTVSLEADGVTLTGEATQEVSIPAGRQALVRWPVTVEDVEFADLTFRAEGGSFSDATKPSFGVGPDQLIPVYRYDGEDITGTSGVLAEAGQQVEAIVLPPQIDPREGAVDVSLSPSLAASLLDTLDYVNDFELATACAHGVASHLLPNLAAGRALRLLEVEDPARQELLDSTVRAAINRLAQLQKANGGWGWCYSDEVDEYLTAYILFALARAEEAGYDLGGVDVDAALRRLPIRAADSLSNAWAANRQAWYLYVLAEWGALDSADLDALFEEQRELLDPYARAYLALAYDVAGVESDNVATLLSDLNNSAVTSAAGAHWEDAERDWRNLSSDIRGTAVVLDALARLEPDNPLAPAAARWLMSARQATHWPTPFETAWSVIALTDWMVASGELDAAYDYAFAVNGSVQAEGSFGEENIAESESVSIPLRRLPQDEVNFLIFDREEGPGRLYYTAYLDAFVNAEAVEPVSRGFTVERAYYDAECDAETETCEPLTSVEAGQRVRVELTIVTPNDRTFVRVEDPLPAGAEAIDPGLATSALGFGGQVERTDRERYHPGYWGWWFFNRIEYRDEKVVFFSNSLPAGTYQYSYTLETPIPGEFQVRPAVAYEEFFPDVFGRSAGKLFTIAE